MLNAMITIALTLALSLGGVAETDASLRVGPGMQETIHVPGLTKVAIGNPSIADVVVSHGDLLLVGKQKGRTNITIWAEGKKPQTRTVVVDDSHTAELAKAVKDVVDANLKVETFNDKIVIMGTVDSMEELQRLHTLVGDDGNVKLLVELNPSLLPVIARQISESFHKHGMPYATAEAVGNRIVLQGSVADQDDYKKAQLIADSYFSFVEGAR
jgi:pilus assembly protein CpaC